MRTYLQTFMPYPSFLASAKVLDMRQLGRQRLETLQIMQMLFGKEVSNVYRLTHTGEYRIGYFDEEGEEIYLSELHKHKNWRQETVPIMELRASPMREWKIRDALPIREAQHPVLRMWRGYEHALLQYQDAICDEWTSRFQKDTYKEKTHFLYDACATPTPSGYPDWIGEDSLHESHQSALVQRRPEYYRQFFPNVPDDLEYVWPLSPMVSR